MPSQTVKKKSRGYNKDFLHPQNSVFYNEFENLPIKVIFEERMLTTKRALYIMNYIIPKSHVSQLAELGILEGMAVSRDVAREL